MEIGKSIGVMVLGYFVIGGVIALTQLGLTKVFEPPCSGTPVHTLWSGFRKNDIVDPSERLRATREGKPADEHLLVYAVRVGLSLAQWLPDLYREVIAGDMTVRNYLLGGYQCVARPKNVESVLHLSRHLFSLPLLEPVQRGSEKPLAPPTQRTPQTQGSRAAAVLSEGQKNAESDSNRAFVAIEPIEGITLELPGDWLERDTKAIEQEMAEAFPGLPQSPQVRGFLPAGQSEYIGVSVISAPPITIGSEPSEFLNGVVKGVKEQFEKAGFKDVSLTNLSEGHTENWPQYSFTFTMVSPSGTTHEAHYILILTPKRTVTLTIIDRKTPPSEFGAILERTRNSLKVAS